tara:strand:+ start:2572 stop:3270 length:699 start_codon:yes stop_codon:yes gene_type:complete
LKFFYRSLLPITLLTGLSLFFVLDLDFYFTWTSISSSYSDFKVFQNEYFLVSLTLFSFLYFLSVSFSLPIVLILTIIGGALFNFYAFFACLFFGTLGCWVVFLASRGFLSEYFKRKVDPYIPSISSNFNKSPFTWLISLRLLPLLPIWLGNIVPGVLAMKTTPFIVATFLGLIPGTLIYISFGSGIGRLLMQSEISNFSVFDYPDIYIPLIALFIISSFSFIIKFVRIKRNT